LQHSPVPVIVVRPTSKREKKKKKRQADPNRRGYLDILEKSAAGSGKAGHVLDRSSGDSMADEQLPVSEGEALAVAKAVGLGPGFEAALQAAHDAQAARLESSASPSPADSPEDELKAVLKSPDPGYLESPESSESDEEEKAESEVETEKQPVPEVSQPSDAAQSELAGKE
jgi:hypothetical protein